jgi:hypothetical protein
MACPVGWQRPKITRTATSALMCMRPVLGAAAAAALYSQLLPDLVEPLDAGATGLQWALLLHQCCCTWMPQPSLLKKPLLLPPPVSLLLALLLHTTLEPAATLVPGTVPPATCSCPTTPTDVNGCPLLSRSRSFLLEANPPMLLLLPLPGAVRSYCWM